MESTPIQPIADQKLEQTQTQNIDHDWPSTEKSWGLQNEWLANDHQSSDWLSNTKKPKNTKWEWSSPENSCGWENEWPATSDQVPDNGDWSERFWEIKKASRKTPVIISQDHWHNQADPDEPANFDADLTWHASEFEYDPNRTSDFGDEHEDDDASLESEDGRVELYPRISRLDDFEQKQHQSEDESVCDGASETGEETKSLGIVLMVTAPEEEEAHAGAWSKDGSMSERCGLEGKKGGFEHEEVTDEGGSDRDSQHCGRISAVDYIEAVWPDIEMCGMPGTPPTPNIHPTPMTEPISPTPPLPVPLSAMSHQPSSISRESVTPLIRGWPPQEEFS